VKKRSGIYPHLTVDGFGRKVVSGAGGVLLTRTTTAVGSGCGVERGAGAVAAAVGSGTSRARWCWTWPSRWRWAGTVWLTSPSYGRTRRCSARSPRTPRCPAASTPSPRILRPRWRAIAAARGIARAAAWALAGEQAPDHDASASAPLVIDVDATLVTAHSEKKGAAPTFKRGFGFHPLWAFVDHGTEEPEELPRPNRPRWASQTRTAACRTCSTQSGSSLSCRVCDPAR
jgi:hypothetical protein